jgi:hypothetical protein
MSWITTKLLAYVSGGLLACLLGLGLVTWNLSADLALAKSNNALLTAQNNMAVSANIASTAMIETLKTQNEQLLLKRAAEAKEVEQLIADSKRKQEAAVAYLAKQNEVIRKLSKRADCLVAMQTPICPAIVAELRKRS